MSSIEYSEHAPHPSVREAVVCYWTLRSDGDHAIAEPRRILPDGCVDIIFNFGDPLRSVIVGRSSFNRLPWYVVGAMTRPVKVQTTGRTDILGIRFRPGYAKPFLSTPAYAFTDISLSLEDVWGQRGAEIGEKLAGTKIVHGRMKILDMELFHRYRQAGKPSGPLKLAILTLLKSGGQNRIADVAAQCGISTRHLGRQFEDAVGLSPKLFANIIRFQKAFSIARQATPPDWLSLVFESGYYDQSHMINDFQKFANCSPARLNPRS